METITAYRCDHCGRLYSQQKSCVKHEFYGCGYNPNNKCACWGCAHLLHVFKNEYFCRFKQQTLFSYKVVNRNMPKQCMDFETPKIEIPEIKLSPELKQTMKEIINLCNTSQPY